jgi:ferredoxin
MGVHPARYKGEGCTGCGVCYYCCPEPGAITVYRASADSARASGNGDGAAGATKRSDSIADAGPRTEAGAAGARSPGGAGPAHPAAGPMRIPASGAGAEDRSAIEDAAAEKEAGLAPAHQG